MTKQEEIREGIAIKLHIPYGHYGAGKPDYKAADELIKYLHSQGVVIKVARELPEPYASYSVEEGYKIVQQDMLDASYVAVEPIIKEE